MGGYSLYGNHREAGCNQKTTVLDCTRAFHEALPHQSRECGGQYVGDLRVGKRPRREMVAESVHVDHIVVVLALFRGQLSLLGLCAGKLGIACVRPSVRGMGSAHGQSHTGRERHKRMALRQLLRRLNRRRRHRNRSGPRMAFLQLLYLSCRRMPDASIILRTA